MIPKLPQGQPRGHTNSAKSKPIYSLVGHVQNASTDLIRQLSDQLILLILQSWNNVKMDDWFCIGNFHCLL